MKLEELVESKRKDTVTKVKLLRLKANRQNPKTAEQHKYNVRGAEDSFTNYKTNSIDQTTWR